MDEGDGVVRPTRRHMLAGIGLGMIGTIAGGARAEASSRLARSTRPAPGSADLARADSAVWSRFIGQEFAIPAVAGASLRLVAVENAPGGGRRPARMRAPFHAIFESVGRAVPESDTTYVVAPRSASPLPLFLAGKSAVGRRHRLVATFG